MGSALRTRGDLRYMTWLLLSGLKKRVKALIEENVSSSGLDRPT